MPSLLPLFAVCAGALHRPRDRWPHRKRRVPVPWRRTSPGQPRWSGGRHRCHPRGSGQCRSRRRRSAKVSPTTSGSATFCMIFRPHALLLPSAQILADNHEFIATGSNATKSPVRTLAGRRATSTSNGITGGMSMLVVDFPPKASRSMKERQPSALAAAGSGQRLRQNDEVVPGWRCPSMIVLRFVVKRLTLHSSVSSCSPICCCMAEKRRASTRFHRYGRWAAAWHRVFRCGSWRRSVAKGR